MNLIEQLGGYEKAKAIVDKAPCKTYTFHNHPYQKGYIRCFGGDGKEYFLVSDIEEALLEYRRQHNIFEIGDKVVFIESELKNPRLMTVIEVSEPICGFLMAECNLGITNGFYPSRYRHATDEEIKAGKRLEVNQ